MTDSLNAIPDDLPPEVLRRMHEDTLIIQAHGLERTDNGAAERVVVYKGDELRFVKEEDRWRIWDGRRWLAALPADVVQVARQISRLIGREVGEHQDDGQRQQHAVFARSMASYQRMQSMMKTASGDARLWRSPAGFEHDPFLINFLNGTYDVRTGKLRDHDPNDHITHLIPHNYEPAAQAPRWEAMVRRVFANADRVGEEGEGEDTYRFAQLCLGYSLLGGNPEHRIFVYSGATRCGKSKMLEIARDLIGLDIAHQSRVQLIAKNGRSGHHTSEQFSLIGKRVVTISETPDTFQLDENQVKSLTGDSSATVYELYTGVETMTRTTWTINVATNHLPNVTAWDDAIKERVVIIPCGPTVPELERVQNLDDIIKHDEAEGVLAWLVEGIRRWYLAASDGGREEVKLRPGLAPPLAVEVATAVFESENDPIGAFIDDVVEVTGDATDRVLRSTVLDRAKRWRGRGEGNVLQRNKLYERILALTGVTLNSAKEFVGVKLRQDHELNDAQREWVDKIKGQD